MPVANWKPQTNHGQLSGVSSMQSNLLMQAIFQDQIVTRSGMNSFKNFVNMCENYPAGNSIPNA